MHNNIQIHDVLADSSCYDVFHCMQIRNGCGELVWSHVTRFVVLRALLLFTINHNKG